MPMTSTLRSLASSEVGFVGPQPTTCAFELTLRGPLDLSALVDAFTALRAAHPALDAVVTGPAADGSFIFSRGESGAPITSGPGVTTIDPTVALGRLHVDSVGDRHRVTLATSHALADGAHLHALLVELWTRYTALLRGSVEPIVPQPFPASAQSVLAGLDLPLIATGRERLGGARWYGSAPTRPARSDGAVLPQTHSIRFSVGQTRRFTEAARGVGVNALLSGILLVAERAGFTEEDPAVPIRIGAMTLVDLRRRIQPTLGATDVTNFVGASFASADLSADADPAAVGSAIAETLRADLAAGRSLAVLAQAAPAVVHDPPVVLSNLGPLALDLPDGLLAEDLRPIVSMDSAGLHTAHTDRRPSPSATIHQISMFQGRLGIEAITLGGTASATSRNAVAARIRHLVRATAALAPAA